MPRGQRSSDSDSSSSGDDHVRRSRRNNTHYKHLRNNRQNRLKVKSSCGIKSVNEYWDKLTDTNHRRASSKACADNGKSKAFAGAKAANHQNGCFSSEANAGAVGLYERNHKALMAQAGANAEFGPGGAIAEADADVTYYCYEDGGGRVEVGNGYLGGGLGAGAGGVKAKVGAGIDAVNVSAKLGTNQAMSANIGLNATTGVEFGVDGVGVSFLGLGFSAGRNTGISTPFGGFSFKLW